MTAPVKEQKKYRVGYLGPEKTYSNDAATLFVEHLPKGNLYDFIPYPTLPKLIFTAKEGRVDFAIVPIENSIEGTIGIVQDLLISDEINLRIDDELYLEIDHALMAPAGIDVSQITEIYSHPQALNQCEPYLSKHFPEAHRIATSSTVQALNQVLIQMRSGIVSAAIGPAETAKHFDLEIISKDIAAMRNNFTRFLALALKRESSFNVEKFKTSIVFSIKKDLPGGLHSVLGAFVLNKRNINLTKIESRPQKTKLGDYYFFIDFQGHGDDKKIAEALSEIKGETSMLKILGSYPDRSYMVEK